MSKKIDSSFVLGEVSPIQGIRDQTLILLIKEQIEIRLRILNNGRPFYRKF